MCLLTKISPRVLSVQYSVMFIPCIIQEPPTEQLLPVECSRSTGHTVQSLLNVDIYSTASVAAPVIFTSLPLLHAGDIMFLGCRPSVGLSGHPKSLWTRHCINCLGEFHQNYNMVQFGTNMNRGQRSLS